MRLQLKSKTSIPVVITNSWELDSIKRIIDGELLKLDIIEKVLLGTLDDKSLKENMLRIYDIVPTLLGEYKIIYTNIPYKNNDIYQYRSYEAVLPNGIDTDILCKIHDERSLKKLIKNGVVLVDMIPFGVMKNNDNLEERSIKADKFPTLLTMKKDDTRYNSWMITTLKSYSHRLLNKDKSKVLEDIKTNLESYKRWGEKSIELTKERLSVEEDLVSYCNTSIKKIGSK